MLFPQANAFRRRKDLSGRWEFRKDPDDQGVKRNWGKGFHKERTILVPASWNEQYQDLVNYLGPAWYQTRFSHPKTRGGQRTFLRFGSVNYHATVWLNGRKLGSHEGGHLPFQFEITQTRTKRLNRLVVRVEALLRPDRVPPGNLSYDPRDSFANLFDPPASFDFFPYCGIQRPVLLFTTSRDHLRDLTVTTGIRGGTGLVKVEALASASRPSGIRVSLEGFGQRVLSRSTLRSGRSVDRLQVPLAKFWAPGSPNLYRLKVELEQDGKVLDQVVLPVGMRTLQVKGSKLLLNGKPVFLKGFGRHEDAPGIGRSLTPSLRRKDFRNMEWTGANSYRTSHYPYAEEDLDLADRKGFLVIDETPAVGLFFAGAGLAKRLKLCRQFIQEMIERDKNHPSVIAWSLANEPHSKRPQAVPFFKGLAKLAKDLDPTRPVTLVSYLGTQERSFAFLDLVCVNRYFGWYSEPGNLDLAVSRLSKDLDAIHRKFRKPILLTEFGADALPGSRPGFPVMYSEEYQREMIVRYLEVVRKRPFVAGAQVWNLNDFRTARAVHRPDGMNYKGVFTRDRRPKLAAYALRERWKKERPDRG